MGPPHSVAHCGWALFSRGEGWMGRERGPKGRLGQEGTAAIIIPWAAVPACLPASTEPAWTLSLCSSGAWRSEHPFFL